MAAAQKRTRKVLQVTLDDGTEQTVNPNRPALILALERQHGVPEPKTAEHIWWLAWVGLGRPDGDLDAWLERVEAIEPVEVEVGKAKP